MGICHLGVRHLLGDLDDMRLARMGTRIRVLASVATSCVFFPDVLTIPSARPAIEPIHFSLPATLHLSLISFPHFTFFLHVRLSPRHTPHARDIVSETCHSFVQLAPGLLPLIPRAAIAIVLLTSFFGNDLNEHMITRAAAGRDPRFFGPNSSAQLTTYAQGVLVAFVAYTAIRLVIVILAAVGLWLSSRHPLGGMFASREAEHPPRPSTPRLSRKRDPALIRSPQKSGVSQENAFQWAWRERTRSRIQDAFELCMMRKGGWAGDILRPAGTPEMEQVSTSGIFSATNERPLQRVRPPSQKSQGLQGGSIFPIQTRRSSTFPDTLHPGTIIRPPKPDNPDKPTLKLFYHPDPSTSSEDIFYTPSGGMTPAGERSSSDSKHAEVRRTLPGTADEFGVLLVQANHDVGPSQGISYSTSPIDVPPEILESDCRNHSVRSEEDVESTSSFTSSLESKAAPAESPPQASILHRARSASARMLRDLTETSETIVRRVKSGTISSDSHYARLGA